MTGNAASAETGPAHWKTRTGPRSAIVSPLMKCATTRMTRYAIENNAITLVYFKESRRRRKESGITMSLYPLASITHHYNGSTYMNAVIQNCRSTKKLISPAPGANPTTTPGIKSPMMIR